MSVGGFGGAYGGNFGGYGAPIGGYGAPMMGSMGAVGYGAPMVQQPIVQQQVMHRQVPVIQEQVVEVPQIQSQNVERHWFSGPRSGGGAALAVCPTRLMLVAGEPACRIRFGDGLRSGRAKQSEWEGRGDRRRRAVSRLRAIRGWMGVALVLGVVCGSARGVRSGWYGTRRWRWHARYQERIVEVPQVQVQERIVHVPRIEIQEREVQVPPGAGAWGVAVRLFSLPVAVRAGGASRDWGICTTT